MTQQTSSSKQQAAKEHTRSSRMLACLRADTRQKKGRNYISNKNSVYKKNENKSKLPKYGPRVLKNILTCDHEIQQKTHALSLPTLPRKPRRRRPLAEQRLCCTRLLPAPQAFDQLSSAVPNSLPLADPSLERVGHVNPHECPLCSDSQLCLHC